VFGLLAVILGAPFVGIVGAKIYQFWDNDPERGAVAITDGAFGESYSTPEYLDQGWDENASLWFYNTTQGSALLPYDFLLVLEQPGLNPIKCERNGENEKIGWFLCPRNVDRFRYLPQKATFFNPDALPVGFAKEPYQGKDYVGYTCAACHTAQINFRNPGETETRALRIDGGPAMADMTGFLAELARAMKLTRKNPRLDRFVKRVVALDNDYDDRAEVEADLEKWTNNLALYNAINDPTYIAADGDSKITTHRELEYGYARLDAFGRIYNRVIQHAINRDQVATELALVTNDDDEPLLNKEQIDKVVEGVGNLILRDDDFTKIFRRLAALYPGGANSTRRRDLLRRVRDEIFNSPNAPVSYPFLWDITRSDYVQWNGLASNAGPGPLGRNAGEVTGVFAILDWQEDRRWFTRLFGFSLSALISGQEKKKKQIYFKSSVNLFNLQRLESHLGGLTSPRWPFCNHRIDKNDNYYLPTIPTDKRVDERKCKTGDEKIDTVRRKRGRLIYADKCQSCHGVIVHDAPDRLMVSHISKIAKAGTDKTMAKNSVTYTGKSGNLKDTYQTTGVGKVIVREDTPVVQILTAAVGGALGTGDPDKWWPRRAVEWVYALGVTFLDNPIKASVKSGKYDPDTTANPYASLLSYRARSLNGILATAPYLHNGSVPTLYDLLLPVKCKAGVGDGKLRHADFTVGAREFDPKKVGFKSEGYAGFKFDTAIPGNRNTGHEYGACRMTDSDRWALIEYLKSL
jgi:cytochrome c5